MLERTRPQSPFYTAEHEAFRDVMRRFVSREIEPYASEWDEAGEFPRSLYVKAAEIGLLGLGFPEEYGGVPADQFMKIVASQEMARAGAGGISASLNSHTIGSPPIARAARPEVKARVLPEILSGQKISALAITEPSGGSDVANLRTKARRGRQWRQPAVDSRRYARPLPHQVEEDGLVGLRHRDLAFRRMPRSR
jgi:acyl-CoA dehydrogenase